MMKIDLSAHWMTLRRFPRWHGASSSKQSRVTGAAHGCLQWRRQTCLGNTSIDISVPQNPCSYPSKK